MGEKYLLVNLKILFKPVALTIGLLLAATFAQGADRYSVATGNWNATSTWSKHSGKKPGESVPVAGDVVYIEGGYNVTVTADAACGEIFFTTSTPTSLTINPGITLNVSGTITIPRSGSGVNTLAVGAGILNVASIAFTEGSSPGNVNHLITISTGIVTVTGNVTQTGSTGSASIKFTGAGFLKIGGTFLTAATGTLTSGTGTVEYNSAGAQTVGDFTYNNLTLSGSGIKTLPLTALSITGDFSMSGTATSTAGAAMTFGRDIIIDKGSAFITGNYNYSFGGNFDNNGTLTTSSGNTFTFNGAFPQTIGGTSASTFNNLTIDNSGGVTLTSSASTTVSGTLTINSGKKFEIAPLKQLLVTGTIANNAGVTGLVIHSDATGDGDLINNSSSVSGTVDLYLPGGLATAGATFHYFVPPVQSMNIVNTNASTAAVSLGLNPLYFKGDFLSYSELAAGSDKSKGWQYFDGYGGTTAFSLLESTKGYNIYLPVADKMTFTGKLNYAAKSFNLSKSAGGLGWNLVGNPYPCNYDLTGIAELMTPDNGIDKTIYFNHNGGYVYYNVLTAVGSGWNSPIVPPLQGFFVHVTAPGTSINLPVASKTLNSASLRAKGESLLSTDLIKMIRLVLHNDTTIDETIVCLIDKATTGFDGDYDAFKLFGSDASATSIYTDQNSVKYAINSLQGPTTSAVIIPVTVIIKTPGTNKIDITEFQNLEGIKVVLKHGAIEKTLTRNSSYSFTSEAGSFTDFQLVIGNDVTGIENTSIRNIKTWYNNNYLYINCPDELSSGRGSLVIYDIQGKPVYTNNLIYLTPGQTIQLSVILPKGVYITRITTVGQPHVSRIVSI